MTDRKIEFRLNPTVSKPSPVNDEYLQELLYQARLSLQLALTEVETKGWQNTYGALYSAISDGVRATGEAISRIQDQPD